MTAVLYHHSPLINSDLFLICFLYCRENDLFKFPHLIMEYSGPFKTPQCLPVLLAKRRNTACDLQSPSHTGGTTSPGPSHVPLQAISHTTALLSLLHWFWSPRLFIDSFNYSAKLYQGSAFCQAFFFTPEKEQLIKQMQNTLIWRFCVCV